MVLKRCHSCLFSLLQKWHKINLSLIRFWRSCKPEKSASTDLIGLNGSDLRWVQETRHEGVSYFKEALLELIATAYISHA
jgi:hypothetical protein